jgi:regulator of sirC expression with transglutaminase-like and TPR domain
MALIDKLLQNSERDRMEAIAELEEQPNAASALRQRAQSLEREARRLRDAAVEIHQSRINTELRKLLSKEDSEIDLLRGTLLVAQLDNEEVSIDEYIRKVDEMADDIHAKLDADASPEEKLGALDRYLFEELGFHGSRGDYYNRANSYLNETIEDREGLPITLSVLYIELAQRLGVEVAGIGLPGHFVVRPVTANEDEPLIDVFERGTRISRDEAEARVLATIGRPLQADDLAPMTKQAILARMVQNLFGIVQEKGDSAGMLRYLGAMLAITPENGQAHLMRGILLVQANRNGDAVADLDWLLEHQPDGIDLEKVQQFRAMILREQN